MSAMWRAGIMIVLLATGGGLAAVLASLDHSAPASAIRPHATQAAHRKARVETTETAPPPPSKEPLATEPPLAEPPSPAILTPQPAVAQQPAIQPQADYVNELLSVLRSFQDSNQQATPPPLAPPNSASEAAPPPPAAAEIPSPNKPTLRVTAEPGAGDNNLSITLQGADIREVLELLSEQGDLNILSSPTVQGAVTASLKGVSIGTALDAILRSTGLVWKREGEFIFVGTPADFLSMRQLRDRIITRVYRPNYVKASDLQTLITPVLSETGTISVSTAATIGIETNDDEVGGDGYAGQEAIVVRDYESILAQVDELVVQIDQQPRQVAIEAMILSIRLDDSVELGVDFEALRNQGTIRLTSGSPLADLGALNLEDGGLKIGFLDSSLALFIDALETVGDTNVIATPRLMCLNKHRAEILIGSELGYVSTTQTETSTTQSVEFLEVGTQLRLRPFISGDGLIRMEVHPELSTGTVRIEEGFTLPDKEVTKVTTNIMVHDGSTVIIGGLMRDELSKSATQIPFFGSLPVVGAVFRQNIETTERREILVLITPRIVGEPHMSIEADKAAMEFHHRHAVYADTMSPLGTRFLGRKYFRLAQDAWAAGEWQRALRLVNLSIEHDPQSRAAIDLRADIWDGRPLGDHTAVPATIDGVGPLQHDALDGQHVDPWLLDQLEHSPQAAAPPQHGAVVPAAHVAPRAEAYR